MTSAVAADPDVTRRPLRRAEFDALVAAGAFEGERIELLGGELIQVSPQGSRHRWIVERLTELLVLGFGGRYSVASQSPLAISDDSEPEPDIAVTDRTTPHSLPTTAHLVVEVAESSLTVDLVHKAPRYAAAKVSQYWVVDVAAREVVVHEQPDEAGYRLVRRVTRAETLSVLGLDVKLADVLPPA